MDLVKIAEVAHDVNAAYCRSVGDYSHLPWKDAPTWQKDSAINGVDFHLNNPEVTPAESHNAWMQEKLKAGWVFGEEKNEAIRTHPCILTYEQLPKVQKSKDFLFKQIVASLAEC